MGIFEKSIPKYVINPIDQTVAIAPEEVYIDDIFDPVFNARARESLRAKYGDGFQSILGGYSDLLHNTWGGDGGIFGKGMGFLSTFGRSMEKADDIVLGGLTETVKGISGQGFENPLKNIFVEDEDYTGKRLLAAMANTMRDFAGGTTVDESDFGTAWNIPSLGIELATDVGILGGSVARKLAPAASEMTSKELLKDLATADAKTAVGDVAQLMSNYDDFMTRVTVDISAPGLRPAFKALKNKLGGLFGTQSPEEWADIVKAMQIIEDDTADLAAKEQAQQYLQSSNVVRQIEALVQEPEEKLSKLPEDPFEDEVFADVYEGNLEDITVDRILESMRRDLKAEAYAQAHYSKDLDKLKGSIKKSLDKRNRDIFKKWEQARKRADKYGFKTVKKGSDETVQDLDKIRQIVIAAVGDDWGLVKHPRMKYTPDELAYLDILKKARDSKDYDTVNSLGTLFPEITSSLLHKTRMSPIEATHTGHVEGIPGARKGVFEDPPIKYSPDEIAFIDRQETALATGDNSLLADLNNLYPDIAKSISAKRDLLWRAKHNALFKSVRNGIKGINKEYAGEVMAKLESDEALIEALETGEWTSNDAVNKAINRALNGLPEYSKYSSPYRVSPSLMNAVKASGAAGNSLAYTILARRNLKDVKSGKRHFNNAKELREFFSKPEMVKKLEMFIPERSLSSKYTLGLTTEDIAKKGAMFANLNRKKFIDLLSEVYFPTPDKGKKFVSQFDYTRKLIALEDFVARNVDPTNVDDTTRFLKGLTSEQRKIAAENPEALLPIGKFLEQEGLASFNAGSQYGINDLIGYQDPIVVYLLTGNLPTNIKYQPKLSKTTKDAARRLRNKYEAELDVIRSKAKTVSSSKYDKYLTRLYNDIETISKSYLQPLRDEMEHPLKSIDSSYSLDNVLSHSTDSDTTFVDLLEKASIGESKAKAAYVPKNRLGEDTSVALSRRILEWVRDTIPANATLEQFTDVVKPLTEFLNVGYKTGAEIPTTPAITEIVDKFYDEVIPTVERLSSNPKYKNINLGAVFAKERAKDPILKIKDDGVVNDIKHLRNLLGAPLAEDSAKHSEFFKRMYNEVVKKHSVDDFKFKSKHGGREVEEINKFLEHPKSPSELLFEFASRFEQQAVDAAEKGQTFHKMEQHSEHFYNAFTELLNDLGTDVRKMDELFQKVRDVGISKLDTKELQLYRAYVHTTSQLLSDVPYKVYVREARLFRPESNWEGIRNILPSIFKSSDNRKGLTEMHPGFFRADRLLNKEFYNLRLSNWPNVRARHLADAPKYYRIQNLLSNVPGRKTSDLPQSLQNVYNRYTSDASKLRRRDEIIKERLRTEDLYSYTEDDLKFVQQEIIPKLPANVRPYWKPSHKQGLFYFDIPEADDAYLFTVGMDVDVRPERFQIESFLKNVPEGARKGVKDISIIDYGTLYTTSGRKRLTDIASQIPLRMGLMVDTPVKLTDVYKETFDKHVRTSEKRAAKAAEKVKKVLVNTPPEQLAEQAYEATSTAAAKAEEVVEKLAEGAQEFVEKGGSDAAGEATFGKKTWRWFKQITDAIAVRAKNAFRNERASLRTKRTSELGTRMSDITKRIIEKGGRDGGYKSLKRFYILRQKQLGDVVSGADFWTTFRRSGIFVTPFEKGSKHSAVLKAQLEHNAKLINDAADANLVEVITKELGNGTEAVIMRFTGDTKTVKHVKKASAALQQAKYADVVFSPPTKLSADELSFLNSSDMKELSDMMDELQTAAADQARYLGFSFDDTTPYTKHAMRRDSEVANYLNSNFYDNITSEEYDELTGLISNFNEYRKTDRGAFGTMLQDRRYRGDYWLLDTDTRSIFEYAPDKIFTSTLADGIFANNQYQSFVDLFINDNFKIKEWFKTPEDLKEVLYAKASNGKLSGNLLNSELVSFKLDENGRIVGLIKYDKMSDAGLAKALADENTILVPANAVSHIDNILKKDVRMNNKFWTFVNKHFTIPFKFGLLSNPGFLLGNVSDAYLKLATTMSQKYGTTVTQELSNVAECINASQVLKNDYYSAFESWKKVSLAYDIKLSPEATIADIVAMSPKYKEDFLKWLDGSLVVPITYKDNTGKMVTDEVLVPCDLPPETITNASMWTLLQGAQMSSNKMREFAELAELTPESRFDTPMNAFERVTRGSGKYDAGKPSTWGIFMNNPYMRTLTDASGAWEDIIRTASILDDLRHGKFSQEDIAKFARGSTGTEDIIQFTVRLDEAKNAMYNAQFDYERQSDFISAIGKVVPFPIFFLKNFQYWMELFTDNPQYVDNVIDIQEGLWSGHNEEDDKFMTEAEGRGAIPIQGEALPKWFKGVYKPSPLQSMFGAFNLLNDPIDNLTYRVNPLIGGAATAASTTLGDDRLTTFFGDPESVKYRPYSTNMYEKNVRFGDGEFNPLEYTLHRMNPYERTINNYLRIPDKVKNDELQLSDVFPSVFQPIF